MYDYTAVSIIKKLVEKNDLGDKEASMIMEELLEGKLSPAQIAAFLIALRMKGETIDEITACAKTLRAKGTKIDMEGIECFDTCGTGGDGGNTFNVSTATAFVLAAAGVYVAKHGNRSVSSRCGSADVLEELGININLPPKAIKECIIQTKMGFMFAPLFHQAMKHAALPRKEIGVRTVFNVLGPLINPAQAKLQLLGVYNLSLVSQIAAALKNLGSKRALVVHAGDGLDEITVTGKTYACELKENKDIVEYEIDPRDYGFAPADKNSIRGGNPSENADILIKIFNGEKGAKRDMLLLNSGAALYVAGKSSTIHDGIKLSETLLDEGSVLKKLHEVREFTKGEHIDTRQDY